MRIKKNLECSMVECPMRLHISTLCLGNCSIFVKDPMKQMNTFVLYIHAENKWFIRDVTGMSLYVLIKA